MWTTNANIVPLEKSMKTVGSKHMRIISQMTSLLDTSKMGLKKLQKNFEKDVQWQDNREDKK